MTTTIICDGQRLSHAIDYMKAATPEGHLSIIASTTDPAPAGVLHMRAMDTACISIVECKLKCTYEGPLGDFAIAYSDIPTDMSGPITFVIDSDMFYIQSGRVRYKAKKIVPAYVSKVQTINVKWPLIFDMSMDDLHMGLDAVCKKIDKKDTQSAVRFTWENNQFIIEDLEQCKVDVVYEVGELNIRERCDTKLVTALPTDYVREMVRPLSRVARCVFAMGNQLPINIGGTTADGVLGCGLVVAPKMIVL